MDNRRFGEHLRRLIEDRDVRQKDLADALGVSGSTLSRYCGGYRMPEADTLVRLAEILQVTVGGLLGVEDDSLDYFIFTRGFQRASDQDRAVVRMLLDRYLTETERAMLQAAQVPAEVQQGESYS